MMGNCLRRTRGLINRFQKRELGPVVYDRQSRKMSIEKMPISTWLENQIMYSWPIDLIDRSGFIRRILKRENMRSKARYATKESVRQLPEFIRFYGINMSDFILEKPEQYSTFNDFFIRELKPGSRPIVGAKNEAIIVSPADSKLLVFDSISDAHRLFIKGRNFSLESLLGNHEAKSCILSLFSKGPVANFRLAPNDYHRFHSPVSGTILLSYHIPGEYFTVKPKALESDVNVLAENARSILCIQTKRGYILFIAIGAEAVGSVKILPKKKVNKGELLGWFEYGGSDIVIFFEHVEFDEDIERLSDLGLETIVRANERIGRWVH
jgi:phosphatidylserine decarboxylase precursor